MPAAIRGIEYYLPEDVLTNEELSRVFPEWLACQIEAKLGIVERRVAAPGETSADLAFLAADKLITSIGIERSSIDYVLFCTQTPDYLLPSSACLIQSRLRLAKSCGAFDFNLGCSGYVYGLGVAKGLIETGQAENVLLLTGETYSKLLRPDDKSTRTLFGDAGAATLIAQSPDGSGCLGPFVYGTDGNGSEDLIVRRGGARNGGSPLTDGLGLCMDGPKIFNFSVREVAQSLDALLSKAGLTRDEIDLFVFHQANKYMLDFLQRKCVVPPEKFYMHLERSGNTVSNTIPIALWHAIVENRVGPGSTVALVGFGVGLSWAGCIVHF